MEFSFTRNAYDPVYWIMHFQSNAAKVPGWSYEAGFLGEILCGKTQISVIPNMQDCTVLLCSMILNSNYILFTL